MQRSGFFVIRTREEKQGPAPEIEASPSGGLEGAGAPQSGYYVRLGWIEGAPYITDLGSSDDIQINATTIKPRVPILIEAGDTITIGDLHLTWNAPETPAPPQRQATDETVIVRRQMAQKDKPETPEATVIVPKRPGELIGGETPPEVSIPPDKSADHPKRPMSDEVIVFSKQDIARVREATSDQTVVVPRKGEEQWEPEVPLAPAIPPAKSAETPKVQVPDETVVVPKQAVGATKGPPRAPESSPSEPPVDTAASRDEAAGIPAAGADRQTVGIDMAKFLAEDTTPEFVSATLIRDTQIPHLVIHLIDRTWEVQFAKERMTIGRDEENDIRIPDPSVSRHHASIERRGDRFVIREAQSRNGIWLGKQRIEKHTLKDGEILSLGRAKLIFKGGFTRDDLTLIGTPRIDGKPARRPVVFVPGLAGSELWLGSERVWPHPKTLISNPELLSLPGDPRMEARKIVSDVVIVPNIVKQQQYSRLGDYLESGLGYTRGKDLLEFAYDWRQDVRLAAQRLAEAIERWQIKAPVTIIGHSLGTLVTRYYVEKLGGKRCVERVILMGGPHYGTPKGLSVILVGPGLLPFGMGDERMRNVIASFPSAYQILPIFPCVTDQDGNNIDVLEDETWLPESQRPYLSAARSFRRELGHVSSVPSVSIFGYGLKTMLRVKIHRSPEGQWKQVEFVEDVAGDLSVPSGSAVLKGSEIHPVFQEHGSLYVDDDVKMRLKVELTRSTTWQRSK